MKERKNRARKLRGVKKVYNWSLFYQNQWFPQICVLCSCRNRSLTVLCRQRLEMLPRLERRNRRFLGLLSFSFFVEIIVMTLLLFCVLFSYYQLRTSLKCLNWAQFCGCHCSNLPRGQIYLVIIFFLHSELKSQSDCLVEY